MDFTQSPQLAGGRLILANKGYWAGLDVSSGQVAWKREVDPFALDLTMGYDCLLMSVSRGRMKSGPIV